MAHTNGQQSTSEICRLVRDTADSIELTVKLDRAGIVVLGDQYFPGWRVHVAAKNSDDYQRREVLRVNRVMRGVYLERGEYVIQFCYKPVLLRTGLVLSSVTWLLLLAWVVLRSGRQAIYRLANVSGRRARRS